MGFWDDSELRLEIKRLKQENDELKKSLETAKVKLTDVAVNTQSCWFVYNNSKLDDIKVGTKLVCVDYKSKLRTEDGRPYNRTVTMVGNKYAILTDDYNSCAMGLVDSIEAVIEYAKKSNYILCEY